MFTLIWAFIVGYNTAGNAYRLDYHFVTNRLPVILPAAAFLLLTSLLVVYSDIWRITRVLLYFGGTPDYQGLVYGTRAAYEG